MNATRYTDHRGSPVLLGSSFARGGEAELHDVAGAPDVVAKVYRAVVRGETSQKLAWMVANVPDSLHGRTTWPLATLHEGGAFRGFLMRRVLGGRELHQTFSQVERERLFPGRDWAFLLAVAEDVCRVVAEVHAAGHVIGDFNPRNVLVAGDGRVTLIDVDSWQIAARDRVFRCPVASEEYAAPELQGVPLHSVALRPVHDAFSLAVVVFRVLFLGRHPFAGRPVGGAEIPLPQAIRERRFAFDQPGAGTGLLPPACSLGLGAVSGRVRELFLAAFRTGSRPAPSAWIDALAAMRRRLRACGASPRHVFLDELAACPWCELHARYAHDFFPSAPARPASRPAPPAPTGPTLLCGRCTNRGRLCGHCHQRVRSRRSRRLRYCVHRAVPGSAFCRRHQHP